MARRAFINSTLPDVVVFDFSTLPPAIHRYNATLGFNRVPGSVDTRPDQ